MNLNTLLLGNMKKLFLLFLILFSVGVQGKENPIKLRVKVVPHFSGSFYVIQYKKTSGFLVNEWCDWPVSNPQTTLERASKIVKSIKEDDSVRVAKRNIRYINF